MDWPSICILQMLCLMFIELFKIITWAQKSSSNSKVSWFSFHHTWNESYWKTEQEPLQYSSPHSWQTLKYNKSKYMVTQCPSRKRLRWRPGTPYMSWRLKFLFSTLQEYFVCWILRLFYNEIFDKLDWVLHLEISQSWLMSDFKMGWV